MRIVVLFMLLLPSVLEAQPAPPRMFLAPDLVIPARTIKADGSGAVASLSVAPDGRMVIIPTSLFGGVHAFGPDGKSLGWKIPVAGPESEIGWVGAVGWMGETLWIGDTRFGQVVLIGRTGAIAKSIEHPSWVRPQWAERRKYPLFASMQPLALYPDSSMLVVPYRSRSVFDTPGYDRTREHLLRISSTGTILRTVAMYDADDGRTVFFRSNERSGHTMAVPFYARSWRVISADGRRIALVAPATTDRDSGTFRITMLDENGDTVYQRRYPQPVVRVNKAAVDSLLARTKGIFEMPAEQVRAKLAAKIPQFRSFLTDVFVGIDHFTWVVQRPPADTARARDALILDDRGTPVATVGMPDGFTPMVVDRAHLWGVERATAALVRFKLQATPPPVVAPTPVPPVRTAKAAAAKAPAR